MADKEPMQDPYAGQGGSYIVDKNGTRRRVEQTVDHPEGNRAREAETEQPATTNHDIDAEV